MLKGLGNEFNLLDLNLIFGIKAMINISNILSFQEFTSSVFLIQRWNDPRLKHHVAGTLSLKGEEVSERIWTPDTYVPNSNQFTLHEKNQLAVISIDGGVYYSAR